MHCEGCYNSVSAAVGAISGVEETRGDLKEQTVWVKGVAPPSAIVTAIENTGRDAILRGSGSTDSSAVCILETHSSTVLNKVRGLARMVQVAPKMTLVDLTINGLAPGQYSATVRQTGDISRGAESTGGIWEALKEKVTGAGANASPAQTTRGIFGKVDVDEKGRGSVFMDQPVAIWELIGRSMVLSKSVEGPFQRQDENTLVGVIARSAGVWDNDKMVCSCSGKNVWQERQEQVVNGMA
ncbi:unnamed protein product [Penicillium salamii]|nr:unnamed protein product [Penicillium salamii]CAG8413038.1 unnamed protein product [Penicillium salamii]